ncbi:hypothetical protein Cfor_10540 [Coptotermes formosanus]|uniref:Uncharacterized protein n=1 Tax=Coptotermes formosanus TaxID=36987 RepID=A0A6L2PE57_COPFO|nr:hypothetical protein Cfor_10540 [Coptotermes formosanus]
MSLMPTAEIFTLYYFSAGNAPQPCVSTAAVCSVLHQGCTHPGNLPLTVRQSPVDVSSHHEGPGSKRTQHYCHQPEPP